MNSIEQPTQTRGMLLIAQLFVILMPFTHVFAFGPWLPLPLLFMLLAFFFLLLQGKLSLKSTDAFLLLVLFLGGLGALFSLDDLGQKNVNHFAAISASIVVYYLTVRTILIRCPTVTSLSGAFVLSTLICSLFIICEFTFRNFYGLNLRDWLPSPTSDHEFSATVLGYLYRPRGFAIEPGHMALAYELGLPLSYLYFRGKPLLLKLGFYVTSIGAFALLFSSAAIFAIGVSLLGVGIFSLRNKPQRGILIFTFIALSVVATSSFESSRAFVQDNLAGKAVEMIDQLSGSEVASGNDRGERYRILLQVVEEAPLGIGWGTASQLGSEGSDFHGIRIREGFTSFFGEVLIAAGLIGLICFLLFLFFKFRDLLSSNSIESTVVTIAFVSLCIHYLFISDYYYPMLWFAIALVDIIRTNESRPDSLLNTSGHTSATTAQL